MIIAFPQVIRCQHTRRRAFTELAAAMVAERHRRAGYSIYRHFPLMAGISR
jgi:hypothetical protein